MRLDGARSATRKEQEGGTVTRATFDFQEGEGLELRDEEFTKNFHVPFKSGALALYSSTA